MKSMVPYAGTNIKKLVVLFGISCVQYAQRRDVVNSRLSIAKFVTSVDLLLALSWEAMAISS